MVITYCQYCNVDTAGNHEHNCPNRAIIHKNTEDEIHAAMELMEIMKHQRDNSEHFMLGWWKNYKMVKDENDSLKKQIDKLANFIMNEVEGEPSQSEGAVDCAIRIIKESRAWAKEMKRRWEKAEERCEFLDNEINGWVEKCQDAEFDKKDLEEEREKLADARIKDAFAIMHLNERVAELYHQYSTLRNDVLAAVKTSEAV